MRALFLLLACCLAIGCVKSPQQGTIHGVVSLNGELVDNGLIRLVPVDGNSQPADSIITQGKYEITTTPGEKNVELFWMQGGSEVVDTATQGTTKPGVQRFPKEYNTETKLKYTVTEGKVEKDFEIKLP